MALYTVPFNLKMNSFCMHQQSHSIIENAPLHVNHINYSNSEDRSLWIFLDSDELGSNLIA